jgi:hypothetical protein
VISTRHLILAIAFGGKKSRSPEGDRKPCLPKVKNFEVMVKWISQYLQSTKTGKEKDLQQQSSRFQIIRNLTELSLKNGKDRFLNY